MWQPQLSVSGYRPANSVLAARVGRGTGKPQMMVAESNGEIIAFADFKPSMPDHRWLLQAFGASTPDVHLAQEQIGEHAHERKDAHDDHPRDSRRRVPVGAKKDSPDDGQLQQHHEGDADDRVAEQVDH